MINASDGLSSLATGGFAVCRQVIAEEWVECLRGTIGAVIRDEPVKPFGVRSIARRCVEVAELAESESLQKIVAAAVEVPFQLVRSILFDKIPSANWHVGWHQDLSIAVKARPEEQMSGFTGWTEKEGITHVQAPSSILEKMVTLRVHLDDALEENGPLRVIPGSHFTGRLASDEIQRWIDRDQAFTCAVRAGDVVMMRPQLLHASHNPNVETVAHRRVIHLEYAPVDLLPEGLEWAEGTSS